MGEANGAQDGGWGRASAGQRAPANAQSCVRARTSESSCNPAYTPMTWRRLRGRDPRPVRKRRPWPPSCASCLRRVCGGGGGAGWRCSNRERRQTAKEGVRGTKTTPLPTHLRGSSAATVNRSTSGLQGSSAGRASSVSCPVRIPARVQMNSAMFAASRRRSWALRVGATATTGASEPLAPWNSCRTRR